MRMRRGRRMCRVVILRVGFLPGVSEISFFISFLLSSSSVLWPFRVCDDDVVFSSLRGSPFLETWILLSFESSSSEASPFARRLFFVVPGVAVRPQFSGPPLPGAHVCGACESLACASRESSFGGNVF